jgi:signal peptide peptidase SppA
MTTDRYPHIRRALSEHPWALIPSYLDLVVEIVDRRVRGEDLPPEEKAARVEAAARPHQGATGGGGVAVVPLQGLIFHRSAMVQDVSGPRGTSTEGFMEKIRGAMRDPDVAAIVVDADTPGGNVHGVEEAADELASLRGGGKPIVTVANAMLASAGYWIGSQTDELVVTPSSDGIGSIGVYGLHLDFSRQIDAEGVTVTYISAGRYKVEGAPEFPLSGEGRDHMQSVVDGYYDSFVDAVARGRRVKAAVVRRDFGEGRTVTARKAVELGMADSIGTLRDTIARLQAGPRRTRSSRAALAAAKFDAALRGA